MPPMMSSGLASAAGPGSGAPAATAVEFTCLFTHDLRRKQKRWEDGRLKYHTFNKRVMVYDERGNFIGDTHWQRDWDFDEGDEFQLERGSVIVQVVECVGRQEQDLSELLDKRTKEKEQRQARVAARPPISAASPHTAPLPVSGARPSDHFQTRHRPLNHLLGTPTGHHGRAVVPSESPFELRQRINENPGDEAESRAAKRRKCDAAPPAKTTFAQNLFGATLSLSAVPLSSAPMRRPAASSAPRQPETQDEPPPSPEPARPVDRALPSRVGTYSGFSRASVAVPRPRVLPEPVSAVVVGEKEGPEPVQPKRPMAPRPEKPTSRPATSVLHSPDADDQEKPPRATVDTTVPSRPKPLRTTMPSLLRKHLERSVEAPGVSESGASFSQAIVLDQGDGDEPTADDRPKARGKQRQAVYTAGSKRTAPNPEKRKPAKRNKLLQLEAQPPTVHTSAPSLRTAAVEEPKEERTELRLKPRQKRGLLFMAEKKNRPKQRKPRETAATTRADVDDPLTRTSHAAMSAPRPAPQPANPGRTTAQRYNPFESSPPDACDPEPQVGSPSTPSEADRPPWEMDEAADEANHRLEPRNCAGKNLCDSEDDVSSQPPSPRGRNGKPRARGFARNGMEATDALIIHREDLSEGSDAEATRPSSSRQTRRTRSAAGQGLDRAGRWAPESASSESDSDELPQPPARPHLARLGRKGIRSRELIGYLPSSSPLVPPAFGPGAPDEEVLIPADATPPLVDEPEDLRSLPLRASRATSPVPQRHSSESGRAAVGEDAVEGPSEEKTDATTSTPQSRRRHSLRRHTPAASPCGVWMDDSAATKVATDDLQSAAAPEKEAAPTTIVPNASAQTTRAATTAKPGVAQPVTTHPQSPPPPDPTAAPAPARAPATAPIIALPPAPPEAAAAPVTAPAMADPLPTTTTTRPRLANPATRGRKAALKMHAAGQAPQPVLPAALLPDVVQQHQHHLTAGRGVVAGAGAAAAAAGDGGGGGGGRPKRTMRFPGFVSAGGGGPWSREAFDLLEGGRPGGD
ncbi:hypothetical protein C8A05DRAFT_18233 [Staphylotrichum tortipilum]|uniref:5'-3' DNA helicase ZGRF1-like N-terminal domain-containing protein n=1 Tax=Staphylotrichum tortipilum TaxID=2831512 RepID=A0AAN6RR19_9PEZI|nr:hypothetical protein C8A05DRAFT_18233 [Staphylotrichum longicolle]